jgi:hypothetical protein
MYFKSRYKKIFYLVYDFGLIPNYFIPKSMQKKLTARSIFSNKVIKSDERGFYYVYPMPTLDDLNIYYTNTYWQSRGKDEGVGRRDLDHYMLIKKFFSKKKITFLNFGAGHGGISHLVYHAGHSVINIEPSGLKIDYKNDNWKTYSDIGEVSEKVDFIYGSHSLEHVQDIDEFNNLYMKILNPKGKVFWEVPNGDLESNGGCNGLLHRPHTYYFTTKFFETLHLNTIINQSYSENYFPNISSENGEVIRYLGEKK